MKPIKNANASDNYVEEDYQELLHDTIAVIESSRVQIAKQINASIMSSHWEIGKLLEERKLDSRHGDQIVKRLSVDLKAKYPNMGLSPRNLWNMKRFYLRYYQEDTKVQRSVALLPWRHNMLLLRHNLSTEHIVFYANEIINKGWSLDMLLLALKSEYHLSIQASEKSNNFAVTMSGENAEYANEIFRSRYHLGFIDAVEPLKELDLERHLVHKISSFIMELGNGFSFIGNQHTLSFNNKDYHVDLLFFHRRLRSMIAIELKIGEFKPEYVGKMNFYLSLLDKLEKAPEENPSIGIILCAGKDHLEVELALQDINKPIGVAEFQYLLPKNKLEEMIKNEINKRNKDLGDEKLRV
jgi:predicted nuclease of restriction endonuclease-like (RecB) superfamily